SAQVPSHANVTYAAIAHYEGGFERDEASRALWEVTPSGVATMSAGVLSTGEFASDMQPLTLHATFTADGVTVTDDKAVVGRVANTVTSPDAWPMYQADERHTGYVHLQFEPSTFSLRWTKPIAPGTALNPVTSVDGRAFVSVVTYFGTGAALTVVDAV